MRIVENDLFLAVRGLVLVACCAGALSGCGSDDPVPALNAQVGHERMLKLLGEIADQSSETHPLLGVKVSRQRLQELQNLPANATNMQRCMAHFKLGKCELNIDNLQTGIEHLTKAVELVKSIEVAEATRQAYSDRMRFVLGTAYIRLGETQNCCLQNSSNSCILPIQGDGLHTRQEGSRKAIEQFRSVLEHSNSNQEDQIKLYQPAKWLMNIAYMTVGEYPQGVPEEYLVPPEIFESEMDFPKFKNIYPQLGLETFNLSGGAIVDDFSNDGYLDMMTSTYDSAGQTQYFRNNRDGTFTERTVEAGLKGLYGGLNMVQADYDNDGDIDVLIVRGAWLDSKGRHPNSLLRNNGNETFTDVTFDAGLGEVHYPAKTAAWGDYDNDGDLDLYIGNDSSRTFRAPAQLFRNNGNGTFNDVAAEAGVQDLLFSMGAVWGDYNHDRYPDLFVSAAGANHLYHNNRDGTFTDVAANVGVTNPSVSFPTWFWDFNNDGALDLYVACSNGNTGHLALMPFGAGDSSVIDTIPDWQGDVSRELMGLYQGDGQGGFLDVTREQKLTGLTRPMGANFGDLDNDGFLDFYLGTGDVAFSEIMPNLMFLNQQGKGFTDITMAGGFGHLQKGHGVSFADIDHDGDQDVYIQLGGAFASDRFNDALFENPGFASHSITIKLVGDTSNRCAIGARIRADIVESGVERSVFRHVDSGGSFGCNPLRQTIGLGQATSIRKLKIYWPTTDQTQTFSDVAVDQIIRITEGVDQIEKLNLPAFRFQTSKNKQTELKTAE
jgi:hypothetical protein